jgi:hypothetical protein
MSESAKPKQKPKLTPLKRFEVKLPTPRPEPLRHEPPRPELLQSTTLVEPTTKCKKTLVEPTTKREKTSNRQNPNNFLYDISEFNKYKTDEISRQDLYLLIDGNLNTEDGAQTINTLEYIKFNNTCLPIEQIINRTLDFYTIPKEIQNVGTLFSGTLSVGKIFVISDINDSGITCTYFNPKTKNKNTINIPWVTENYNEFIDSNDYIIALWSFKNTLEKKHQKIIVENYNLKDSSNGGGHATSLLIRKKSPDIFDVYMINSGLGLNKHEKINIESREYFFPLKYENITKAQVNSLLYVSQMFEYYFGQTTIHSDIENLYTIIEKITKKKPIKSEFHHKQQLSGSCSFYSIKLAFDYYLKLLKLDVELDNFTRNLKFKAIERFKSKKDKFCWDYYNIAKIIENKYKEPMELKLNEMWENYVESYDYMFKLNDLIMPQTYEINVIEKKNIIEYYASNYYGGDESLYHILIFNLFKTNKKEYFESIQDFDGLINCITRLTPIYFRGFNTYLYEINNVIYYLLFVIKFLVASNILKDIDFDTIDIKTDEFENFMFYLLYITNKRERTMGLLNTLEIEDIKTIYHFRNLIFDPINTKISKVELFKDTIMPDEIDRIINKLFVYSTNVPYLVRYTKDLDYMDKSYKILSKKLNDFNGFIEILNRLNIEPTNEQIISELHEYVKRYINKVFNKSLLFNDLFNFETSHLKINEIKIKSVFPQFYVLQKSNFKDLIISILNNDELYNKLFVNTRKLLLKVSNLYLLDNKIHNFTEKIEKFNKSETGSLLTYSSIINKSAVEILEKSDYSNLGESGFYGFFDDMVILNDIYNCRYYQKRNESDNTMFMPMNKYKDGKIDREYITGLFTYAFMTKNQYSSDKIEKMGGVLNGKFYEKDFNHLFMFNSEHYIEKKITESETKFTIKCYDSENYSGEINLYFDFTTKSVYGLRDGSDNRICSDNGLDEFINLINTGNKKCIYYKNNVEGIEEIHYNNDKYFILNKNYIKLKSINKIIVRQLKNLVTDLPNSLILCKNNKYYMMILPSSRETHKIYSPKIKYKIEFELIELDLYGLHLFTNSDNYKELFSLHRENIYNSSISNSPFNLYYSAEKKEYKEYIKRKYYFDKFTKETLSTKLEVKKDIKIDPDLSSYINKINKIKLNFTKEDMILPYREDQKDIEKNIQIDPNLSSYINKINKKKLNFTKEDIEKNIQSYYKNIKEIIKLYNKYIISYNRTSLDNQDFIKKLNVILDDEIENILLKYIDKLWLTYFELFTKYHYQEYLLENRDLIYNIIIAKKLLRLKVLASVSKDNIEEVLTYYRENLSKEYIDFNFDQPRLTGQLLLEIFSGSLFRNKQSVLIKNILEDIDKSDNLYDVNQLIMGMGKTSYITPSLILHFTYCSKYYDTVKKIIICLPETLVHQTKQILNFHTILNINKILTIKSDQQLKLDLIDNYKLLENEKCLLIIDEFDSVYNPLTSNLNIPELKVPINDKKYSKLQPYIIKYVNLIVEQIDSKKYNPNIELVFDLVTDDSVEKILNDTLKKCCNMKYNLNYGLNKSEDKTKDKTEENNSPKDMYKAIPYSAADTPVEKSDFSEIDFLFILTIMSLAYIDFREIDYKNIMKLVITDYDRFSEFDDPNMIESVRLIGEENIKEFKNLEYINKIIKTKINNSILFFKKYLILNVIKNLKFTISQKNISFMDIIGLYNVKKVGFSGTTNLTLPNYTKFNSVDYSIYNELCQSGGSNQYYAYTFNQINNDNEAQGSIYYSILSSEKTKPFKLPHINNEIKTDILDKITDIIEQTDYNCLIDTAGLLFTFNSKNIIDFIVNKFKNKFDRYIYIDNENNKKIIIYNELNNKEISYSNEIITMKDFILYDNKHIIGQDIKQSHQMKGLCTVNNKLTLTLLAQGIYRLRKMNWGHTVNFIIDSSINSTSRMDILIKTWACEEFSKYTSYELSKLIQNYKTLYRNYPPNFVNTPSKSRSHIELFMEQVYNKFSLEDLNYEDFINSNLDKFKKYSVFPIISSSLEEIKSYILSLNKFSNLPSIEFQINEETNSEVVVNHEINKKLITDLNRIKNIDRNFDINTNLVSSKLTDILDILRPRILDKVTYHIESGDAVKKFNIVLLDCMYNGVTYYIYNKIDSKYYFILINSVIFMSLKSILDTFELEDKFSFIVKKDKSTIIFKYGDLNEVKPEDDELESYINYCMYNKNSVFDIVKTFNICEKNSDLLSTYDFITTVLLRNYKGNISYSIPITLNDYKTMKNLINYLFDININPDYKIILKSKEKFELIKQMTEYIKTKFTSEFIDDLFRLEESKDSSATYYKKYLLYKTKYIKLKDKLSKVKKVPYII